MKRINIFINEQEFAAELNGTKTAQRIYDTLPIVAEGNFWGEEIYFEIPLKMENEKPTKKVRVGDLAYWPPGKAFCIFYGKTPPSSGEAPVPASPVTVVGKIKGNLEPLKDLKQAKIKIIK